MATSQSTPAQRAQPSGKAIVAQALDILTKRLRKPGNAISSPVCAKDYLRLQLLTEDREVFAVLFLDNRHRMIAFEKLFYGSIDSATVHTREIARYALRHNAATVILAHNHPSGDPSPSNADIHLTRRIRDALNLVEVRTLDHIIIGRDGCCAFSERGLINADEDDNRKPAIGEPKAEKKTVALATKIVRYSEKINALSQVENPNRRQKAALTMARTYLARTVREIRSNQSAAPSGDRRS